jgi:hypothetical protein
MDENPYQAPQEQGIEGRPFPWPTFFAAMGQAVVLVGGGVAAYIVGLWLLSSLTR